MSILTVILADTKDEALAVRPAERSGFKRQESLEEHTVHDSARCPKCDQWHVCPTSKKLWRLSVTDTK